MDFKTLFLLLLIMRPFGLLLVFVYDLITEIRWLHRAMYTLLDLEDRDDAVDELGQVEQKPLP